MTKRELCWWTMLARESRPPCTWCGRDNHPTEKCIAMRHEDDLMLHTKGGWSKAEDANVSRNSIGTCCHEVHELIFLQPTTDSRLTGPMSFSNGFIPATCILIDSQSTINVLSNGDMLSRGRWVNTTIQLGEMLGLSLQTWGAIYLVIDGCGISVTE